MDEQHAINSKLDAIAKELAELKLGQAVINQKLEDHLRDTEKQLVNCARHQQILWGNGSPGIKTQVDRHEHFIISHTAEHTNASESSKWRWYLGVAIATAIATAFQALVPLVNHAMGKN